MVAQIWSGFAWGWDREKDALIGPQERAGFDRNVSYFECDGDLIFYEYIFKTPRCII